MSTKRKKKPDAECNRRVVVDRYGHQYHSLCFGDKDRPEEEALEIFFSRLDPPIHGEDSHEAMFRSGDQTVIVTRSFIVEMLLNGWNGELSNNYPDCHGDHEIVDLRPA